ncbi:hypothetical protein EDF84_103241 [Erwinia rhapontici]|nr:hypothetical protein EDF84_103241 [Erwinia rhapontici]
MSLPARAEQDMQGDNGETRYLCTDAKGYLSASSPLTFSKLLSQLLNAFDDL